MKIDFSRYRHIIWDWNGTLLDDKWLCIESINRLLGARNLPPIDEAKYDRIFRFPVRDYYRDAGFDFNLEPYEVPAMQFIDLYDERKKDCRLQPGAREILTLFNSLGYKQYLLSASETNLLGEMTAHFGISKFFSRVKGLDNHFAHGKEDLGRELIREIGDGPDTVLMIGDTCHDKEVADLMGIDVVLLSHGHFPEERLIGCGSLLVGDLIELRESLSGIQSLHG